MNCLDFSRGGGGGGKSFLQELTTTELRGKYQNDKLSSPEKVLGHFTMDFMMVIQSYETIRSILSG